MKSKKGFIETLKAAKAPAVIVGAGALSRDDGAAILALAAQAAKALGASFNVLHTAASRVGGLDLGFVPKADGLTAKQMVKKGAVDLLFLMGADEIDLTQTEAFVVYMGTHGDAGAHRADVILPGAAYTEKNGLYVNIEGRVQLAGRAVFPKGEAREDWAILRALSERMGATLPYDSLDELRAKLFADHPTFASIDYVAPAPVNLDAIGTKGEIVDAPFGVTIADYYLTNPIARASVTMAECSQLRSGAARMAAE
jgi:NADH-quinone oxidoreductase subunit G